MVLVWRAFWCYHVLDVVPDVRQGVPDLMRVQDLDLKLSGVPGPLSYPLVVVLPAHIVKDYTI